MNDSQGGAPPLHLLLVEDDDGDAILVEELLHDSGLRTDVTRAWSLQAAVDALVTSVDCVLLDLGLPDASGLDALVQLREASEASVVVLTGLDDAQRGVEAVAAGADDYLVKGSVDGESLGRAIRYAVERRRGERERQLQEARRARAEQVTQLVQELRSVPYVPRAAVRVHMRSEDSDTLRAQLCDVVERPDGTVAAIIGTADGTGTAAAALAATVRASFRALALTALPTGDVVEALDRVISSRPGSDVVCALIVEMDPASRRVTSHLAGHHPPLTLSVDGAEQLTPTDELGVALGGGPGPRPVLSAPLREEARMLLLHNPILAQATGHASQRSSLAIVLSAATRGAGDEALADTVARAVLAYGPDHAEVQLVLLGWAPA